MYGSNTGTLNVYYVDGGLIDGVTDYQTGPAIWSKKGDQGDFWNIGQVSCILSYTSESFIALC